MILPCYEVMLMALNLRSLGEFVYEKYERNYCSTSLPPTTSWNDVDLNSWSHIATVDWGRRLLCICQHCPTLIFIKLEMGYGIYLLIHTCLCKLTFIMLFFQSEVFKANWKAVVLNIFFTVLSFWIIVWWFCQINREWQCSGF